FKGSVLLVAAFCEPSGSIGHHVGSLVKAGSSLQVHLLRWLPQTQTADRAFWQIFIEAGREVVRGVSSVELKTHDVQLSAQDTAARAAAYDALGAGDKKHILVRPEDAAIGIVSGWQAFSASAQKNYKSTALYHIVFETDNRGLLGDAGVYVEPGATKPAGFDLRE
ncbi:MAG: hypothetical protein P4M02_08720, partial [Clostridia bacterium]|nr:hypothetical protein [Clostridia bacterium]